MKHAVLHQTVRRRDIFAFTRLVINPLVKMIALTLISPKNTKRISSHFVELHSRLWDHAEHSISHQGFSLPSAIGTDAVHSVNALLCELYGNQFASLSFGGSSGAMVTLLTAVLPKLNPEREVILFDDICHQSTIGGLIFGRWKAVRIPRTMHDESQSVSPIKFEALKSLVEQNGPDTISAIILVLPSYDGFRSPSEDKKIYQYAKSLGIPVIVDGAWDALRFHGPKTQTPPLNEICDVWITSPHKRGLTPSSLGCMLTQSEHIARLWDEALDLGFRSSSVSFVEIMIAEHRLSQILLGQWDNYFKEACEAAKAFRSRIKEIHPGLDVIHPSQVEAETHDPKHILIHTGKIAALDARAWAKTLATDFSIDVEKATGSSLLLICGDPSHLNQIDTLLSRFRSALEVTLKTRQRIAHDA